MKKNSHAFVIANQLLLCLIVAICGGGAVGVSTVWMRHQVSRTADHNRELRASLQRVERQIAETTALVEGAQNPAELRHRNAEFKIGLEQIQERQVTHVSLSADDRLRRMRAKSNHELLKDGVLKDVGDAPVFIDFRLAQNH